MTPSTGKRSSRACLRCRRRKTRCDLQGIGQANKAPCVSCHQTGSECILMETRRGGNFRPQRRRLPDADASVSSAHSPLRQTPLNQSNGTAGASDYSGEGSDGEEYDKQTTPEDLCVELRNPSDALQILAMSGGSNKLGVDVAHQSPPRSLHRAEHRIQPSPQLTNDTPGSVRSKAPIGHGQHATVLDDFELVQRGLLHPSLLPELLHIYKRKYHPYCPIAPAHMFGPSAMERIARADYFLLTVLLAIGSRDAPEHALAHRYCWDHAQRLLLDIVLARPWTQTPRTIEGLLLLAEWLPHIHLDPPFADGPKNLFSEDTTAWSLLGLAVRLAYMLRLDRAAFRNKPGTEPGEEADQKTLIWAAIFVADRQIAVRLGQAFWSRGPSLSSNFTAKDFSSLQPRPGINDEDYASVMQATMELTQILHNAHAILYSSRERTIAMVHGGDYPRYLDDLQRATATWHSTWSKISVSANIKTILLLLYEYIRLYVNAFSFQAAVMRASAPRQPSSTEKPDGQRITDIFSRGIMSTPDGIYVFDAISAATNVLTLLNSLDPRQEFCYLPSRYALYGVYAAVFLHKAQSVGAFQSLQSQSHREDTTRLVLKFISVMDKAATTESHICRRYCRMLKALWHKRARRASKRDKDGRADDAGALDVSELATDPESTSSPAVQSSLLSGGRLDPMRPAEGSDTVGRSTAYSNMVVDPVMSAFPATIDEYLLNSFMPGVAGFDQGELGIDPEMQGVMLDVSHDWGLNLGSL